MKFHKGAICGGGVLILILVFLSCQVNGLGLRRSRDSDYSDQIQNSNFGGYFGNASELDSSHFALSPRERNFRKSKFFPLFTIIRFTNEVCRTSNEEHGICYTKHQCLAAGGTALGNCAQGLGVCCRFVVNCGGIVTQNGTAFQNPNYPSRYTPSDGSNVCQIRVRRQFNVCQLRLNFIAFDIEGPSNPPGTAGAVANNDAGTCKLDSLSITASGGTIPNLCGQLSNQHVYVDFGSSDTITLNLLLSGNVQARERLWNVEMLMIPCSSVMRAPTGCLQYFTGISGRVESFNFLGGQHYANMDYSACVRTEDGMRFIDWSPCNPGDVRISGQAAAATMPTACAAVGLVDYIIIMGGVSFPLPTAVTTPAGISSTDRFCDTTWPTAVTAAYVRSSVRPFILHFRTDGMEVPQAAGGTTEANAGFCLRWQQNPQ